MSADDRETRPLGDETPPSDKTLPSGETPARDKTPPSGGAWPSYRGSLRDGEILPGVPYRAFVRAATGCTTEAEFRSSAFYRQHGEALERLLSTPRIVARTDPQPPQHSPDRFRIVHWNIEKGKQLSRIVERLRDDPILADADVYSFNEVDVGMARSGNNADVAQVLADALHCHHAFVPSYLECTKGPGEESLAPGENTRGWHGLAILSRFPIESARVIPLPSCFDYYDFFEKRYGRRQGLAVRIRWRRHLVEVISTHLEVRNTPQCRARQMHALLEGLEDGAASLPVPKLAVASAPERSTGARREGGSAAHARTDASTPASTSASAHAASDASTHAAADASNHASAHTANQAHELPQVIAGDFNTNSFRRGSVVRSAREFARIVASSPEALDRELREPYAREPLFALLERRGFSFRDLSDGQPTAEQILGSAEDLEMLPPPMRSWLSRTFGLGTRVLRMRLDWIAARGWAPLEARTHAALTPDGPASDHAAIHADLELE